MPDLDALAAALQAFAQGQMPAATLTQRFRDAVAQWPELPPRYRTVLEQLLSSLESRGTPCPSTFSSACS